jgi:hypothetical protein
MHGGAAEWVLILVLASIGAALGLRISFGARWFVVLLLFLLTFPLLAFAAFCRSVWLPVVPVAIAAGGALIAGTCRRTLSMRIFLSYAREDEVRVREIYLHLERAGYRPWMDKQSLEPGSRWEAAIRVAIRNSEIFMPCLSPNSIGKTGIIRKEVEEALDIWRDRLDSDYRVIPVRIAECDLPESLQKFEWVDLCNGTEWDALVNSVRTRTRQ